MTMTKLKKTYVTVNHRLLESSLLNHQTIGMWTNSKLHWTYL